MNRIRALCISRNYPNVEFPRLGVWARRLVEATGEWCETKVIAPVPWSPPFGGKKYTRYRNIPRRTIENGIEVFHPRVVVLPGMRLHSLESRNYFRGVSGLVRTIHESWPFDLIHAHFIYPDGVVAARLARNFGVPFLVTEHASWRPWLDDYPRVRRLALDAARNASRLIAVSHSLANSMTSFGVERERISVIPNVVDESVFNTSGRTDLNSSPRVILFVGIVRKVKGVDVLLRALRLMLDNGTDARLKIVGESFYSSYARDYGEMKRLCTELGLDSSVDFAGAMTPEEVAAEMRRSSVVVLPSRRETFGVVLAEALACGTPVVATRCGGPEDIVDVESGLLVEPEDPAGLAAAIERVLSHAGSYEPLRLEQHSLQQFGSSVVGAKIHALYKEILA